MHNWVWSGLPWVRSKWDIRAHSAVLYRPFKSNASKLCLTDFTLYQINYILRITGKVTRDHILLNKTKIRKFWFGISKVWENITMLGFPGTSEVKSFSPYQWILHAFLAFKTLMTGISWKTLLSGKIRRCISLRIFFELRKCLMISLKKNIMNWYIWNSMESCEIENHLSSHLISDKCHLCF